MSQFDLQNNAQADPHAPQQHETIIANATRVGCDGGAGASQGALGHPLVWLTLKPDQHGRFTAACGYCDRRFVLAAGVQDHSH